MLIGTYDGRGHDTARQKAFAGLNRTRRVSAGELTGMTNMGTLEYPCAAPRGGRRAVFEAPGAINAIAAPNTDGFTGVANGGFYCDGALCSGSAALSADFAWEIMRMGNIYIINGYDAANRASEIYYYNVDNGKFAGGWDAKSMTDLIVATGTDDGGSYLATFRYGFSSVYDYTAQSEDGSQVIKNADFFDKYGDPVVPPPNIFEQVFAVGEQVEISGFPTAERNFGQVWMYLGSTATVTPLAGQDFSENNTVDTDLLETLDGVGKWEITDAFVKGFAVDTVSIDGAPAYIHKLYLSLYNRYGEEIGFTDMIDDSGSRYCTGVTLSRRRRVFDHIAVHNGRLWGSSPTGNRLYISNSADIFDFTPASIVKGYAGRLESDPPGTFTALAALGSELVAFKEDSITVVYGTAVCSAAVIAGIGCIDGRSVAATPSGLIFLSAKGFYLFSGAEPVKISEKLGRRYISAVGGFDGEIYYASAGTHNGETELLTYDLRYGLWHRHDDLAAVGFYRHKGRFYMAGTLKVYELDCDSGAEPFTWEFSGAPYYSPDLGLNAVCEIWIRAELDGDAEFTVYTSVDGGALREHATFKGGGMRMLRCPIRAVMGGRTSWSIKGRGTVVFYEIELRTAANGGKYI